MMELYRTEAYALLAHGLEHSVPTIGYRLEEPDFPRFVPEKLNQAGVQGAQVGELRRNGSLRIGGRIVRLEEVSVRRPGGSFAFVMDTRPCPGAVALARDADLLVMEATYTSEHQDLADLYLHATAEGAARTAQSAGAHRLAMTHFSQRYTDTRRHLQDARRIFANVIALEDLDRVAIPRRP
jgi:ribonuclease Z